MFEVSMINKLNPLFSWPFNIQTSKAYWVASPSLSETLSPPTPSLKSYAFSQSQYELVWEKGVAFQKGCGREYSTLPLN